MCFGVNLLHEVRHVLEGACIEEPPVKLQVSVSRPTLERDRPRHRPDLPFVAVKGHELQIRVLPLHAPAHEALFVVLHAKPENGKRRPRQPEVIEQTSRPHFVSGYAFVFAVTECQIRGLKGLRQTRGVRVRHHRKHSLQCFVEVCCGNHRRKKKKLLCIPVRVCPLARSDRVPDEASAFSESAAYQRGALRLGLDWRRGWCAA